MHRPVWRVSHRLGDKICVKCGKVGGMATRRRLRNKHRKELIVLTVLMLVGAAYYAGLRGRTRP